MTHGQTHIKLHFVRLLGKATIYKPSACRQNSDAQDPGDTGAQESGNLFIYLLPEDGNNCFQNIFM